jgi:hypothetical protein
MTDGYARVHVIVTEKPKHALKRMERRVRALDVQAYRDWCCITGIGTLVGVFPSRAMDEFCRQWLAQRGEGG